MPPHEALLSRARADPPEVSECPLPLNFDGLLCKMHTPTLKKKEVTFSISTEGEFCPRLPVPPELLICVRGLQISFWDSLMTIIFGKSHRGFIWMLEAMASVPDGELVQKSTDRGHG